VRGASAKPPNRKVSAAESVGATGPSCASAGAELVADNVTLPLQRLRESVSDLIKTSEDKDIARN